MTNDTLHVCTTLTQVFLKDRRINMSHLSLVMHIVFLAFSQIPASTSMQLRRLENSIVVLKALKCGVYKFLQHNGDKSVRITVEELSSFEHFSVEGAAPLKFIDCLSDLNSTKSKKIMQNYAKI